MIDWWFVILNKIPFECLLVSSYFLVFLLCPLLYKTITINCFLYLYSDQSVYDMLGLKTSLKTSLQCPPWCLLHYFLLPSILVVSAWCRSACSTRFKACEGNRKNYLLLLLQQRGSLMSEWVIPFEELAIAWSPLGSGRFGKVYRQVYDVHVVGWNGFDYMIV